MAVKTMTLHQVKHCWRKCAQPVGQPVVGSTHTQLINTAIVVVSGQLAGVEAGGALGEGGTPGQLAGNSGLQELGRSVASDELAGTDQAYERKLQRRQSSTDERSAFGHCAESRLDNSFSQQAELS